MTAHETSADLPSAMVKFVVPSLALLLVVLLLLGRNTPTDTESRSDSPVRTEPVPTSAPAQPAGKTVKLPGLSIDLQNHFVDLEAQVCLEEGALELVACTKGTKEHESIVAIESRPMHVHTALLLLGARNGNPAMQRPADEEGTRWIHLPPRGDRIDVSLVFPGADGKQTESPIANFITRTEDPFNELLANGKNPEPGEKFSAPFLFTGSIVHEQEEGPPQYLADASGNVISISTFGDEVLGLPSVHSQDNPSLAWQVDSRNLPKVGTKVILRLRPQKPVANGTKP